MTERISIFLGNRDGYTVKRLAEFELTGKPGHFVTIIGSVEQIIFILAHRRKLVSKGRIDMDMAGGAGAAASAQREQLVNPTVPDNLHDRKTVTPFQNNGLTFTGNNVEFGHHLLRYCYARAMHR